MFAGAMDATGEGDGRTEDVTTTKPSGQGKRSRRHRRQKTTGQDSSTEQHDEISTDTSAQTTGNDTIAKITGTNTSVEVTGNDSADITDIDTSGDITGNDTIVNTSGIDTSADITGNDACVNTSGFDTSADITGTDISVNVSGIDTRADITGIDTTADTSHNDSTGKYDIEDVDLGSVADLDGDKRNVLYDRGLRLARAGRLKAALKCYLHCLTGLDHANGFTCLPLCLRNVADIYYKQEEYEKAIQFIQAEKLYYETALIDTSELRRKLGGTDESSADGGDEQEAADTEAARADEYEKLARMCLEKNQPQLALEYQGKATKLRQQLYGDEHPTTIASLDFFTVVYGEAGKQQYSESLRKLGNISVDEQSSANTTTDQEKSTDGSEIVQQASPDDSFDEALEDVREQEEYLSRAAVWVLFSLCILCLSLIMFYAYCKLDTTSRSCSAWRADMHYHYMRIKYYYYYYVATSDQKTYV